ncbi:MAG: hypothetical protein J7L53_07980 [Deltaproteobacteria bacterium]|nr:hypothetical protein [Deltaproteobacteria bacterium]
MEGSLPKKYSIYKERNTTIIYTSDRRDVLDKIPAYGPIGRPSGLRGRSKIYILDDSMAVRPLVHGGVLRYFTQDRFLTMERSIRELKVSLYLISKSIPTPEILAIRFIRKGIFYNICVISVLVPDSIDLMTYLATDHSNSGDILKETGKLVRDLHALSVFHSDLHIKNILLDKNFNPWILDLDKARRLRYMPSILKWLNIRRFFRSCKKWENKGRIMLPADWEACFMDGYKTKD